jgi:DNA polymerase (family 10)
MQPGKHEVIEMLRELAQLTMLDEENPQSFRVRAYESAEHAIAAQTVDLRVLSLKELQAIEGIGKSTAERIRELLDTGRVEKLEALRQKHPESVVALLRIQGLGPKMLGRLRAELGVHSLDDLRRVLSEQRLRGLKGFGEKSEEKLRQSLSRLDSQGALDRTPIAAALPLAEGILAELRAVPGVSNAIVAGSLRRFSETIGDVDIIVTAAAAEPVMLKLTQLSAVDRVLAHGEGKTSVVPRRG